MDGKFTKTERLLLAMAAGFLAVTAVLHLYRLKTAAVSDYTVTPQYQLEAPREELVNINTASREELEQLDGIGPALAQRIIDYREANGPFQSAGELLKVSGIGETVLAKIRNHVTVG